MEYEKLDTRRLRKLADDLRYDSSHKMEEVKRVQAKIQLSRVETEIRNREGFRGLFRLVKKFMGGRSSSTI
jgi:hypothetical protein